MAGSLDWCSLINSTSTRLTSARLTLLPGEVPGYQFVRGAPEVVDAVRAVLADVDLPVGVGGCDRPRSRRRPPMRCKGILRGARSVISLPPTEEAKVHRGRLLKSA